MKFVFKNKNAPSKLPVSHSLTCLTLPPVSHSRARYNVYSTQQFFSLFLSITSITSYKLSFHIHSTLAWFLEKNGHLRPCIDRWDEMKWEGSTRQYWTERVKIWDERKGSEIIPSVWTTLKYLVNLKSAVLSSCSFGLLRFYFDLLIAATKQNPSKSI